MFRLNRWIVIGIAMLACAVGIWSLGLFHGLGSGLPGHWPKSFGVGNGLASIALLVSALTLGSGIYFNVRKDRREEHESTLRIAKERDEALVREAAAAAGAVAASDEERRKEKLRGLLLNPPPGQKWRTMETLSRSIAADEEETTRLLKAIGARRSLGERNVWTLLA